MTRRSLVVLLVIAAHVVLAIVFIPRRVSVPLVPVVTVVSLDLDAKPRPAERAPVPAVSLISPPVKSSAPLPGAQPSPQD